MRPVTLLPALLALLSGAALAASPPGAAKGAEATGFDQQTGERVWVFKSDTLEPVPNRPTWLNGTGVRLTLYQKGKAHVLTADRGTVDSEKHKGTFAGNVVITFDDEQATRVETDGLAWDGATGIATTPSPVKITRTDLTATGLGARMTLRETHTGEKKPERADELILEKSVRVVIQPGNSGWLLSREPGPKKDGKSPAQPAAKEPPAKAAEPPKAANAPPTRPDAPRKPEPDKPAEPILVTCAGPLAVYRDAMTAVFRDNVRAVQGAKSVTCDLLHAVMAPAKAAAGDGKPKPVLSAATAVGKVRIDDTGTVALADLALWQRKETPAQPGGTAEKAPRPPAGPKKGSAADPKDGSVKLIGQPAQVTWDNGNRLCAPIIYRLEDGSEFICSPSEDQPAGVYLLAHPVESRAPEPPQSHEPAPKPAPADR